MTRVFAPGALLLVAALLAPRAEAYELMGYAWSAEDFPLQWYMTDYEEDSLENATQYGYDSVSDYQIAMTAESYANWYEADCAEISDAFAGIDEGNEGYTNDGINKYYFDDPTSTLGAGVLAAALSRVTSEFLREQDGMYLYRFGDVDIAFNDNINWGLTEELEEGCTGESFGIEHVQTHEIGHQWGMGHSCEEDDVCTDEAKRYATMYWQTGACDLGQAQINSDDIAGINALYGPYATFSTDDERFGGIPMEVCFDLYASENAEITDVLWSFGDGDTSTELEPCHTYENQGQFSVVVTINGTSEACDDWSFDYRERSYVVACAEPGPGIDPETGDAFGGLFTYQHVEGLEYQLVNRADTSVYGCLDTVLWQIYQGETLVDELSAWSPKVILPDEGTYRVLLNVGGPGGMAAAELEIDTTADKDGGCNSAPVGLGLLGLLSSLGLAISRRRQRA
ncbi:MAG: PKD domain-containing protein [Pseudomonadota bacterium]